MISVFFEYGLWQPHSWSTFFCLSYVDLRKFGKIWLYLRYPCCSSMNFDPSPVDKYNSVNSPNSGCNLKLSIVERFSRCLIKVKLPYCSSRDFSSPVDKNNSVNSSNRKGWLSVYERLPRFRTIIWTRKKYVANAMPEKQRYLN